MYLITPNYTLNKNRKYRMFSLYVPYTGHILLVTGSLWHMCHLHVHQQCSWKCTVGLTSVETSLSVMLRIDVHLLLMVLLLDSWQLTFVLWVQLWSLFLGSAAYDPGWYHIQRLVQTSWRVFGCYKFNFEQRKQVMTQS